ncbi:MAG: 6-carboxytetrahydropterin synthase [Bdellovibrionales bacterium]
MGLTTWTRRFHFQCVHTLQTGAHSERLHGHWYELEVSSRADGPVTRAHADMIVASQILNHVHGQDLSAVLAPSVATGETLVEWIHARLQATELGTQVLAVALQETRKNRFISAASEARFV